MEYKNVVRDFAERTRKNLDMLRRLQNENPDLEIYEVTQLVNSLLGLLVFPQQSYFNSIPETPLEELVDQGWPVPEVIGPYPQAKDLKELVRYLRNGIAHFNIKFQVDGSGEISGLELWNRPPRGKINWRARYSLDEVELITEKFLDLLLEEQPTRVGQARLMAG